MLYGKYNFLCRLENEAVLPAYKGSTFRGVFGHALKKVVCALKRQDCKQCLLQQSCLYSIVFETPTVNEQKFSRISTPPRPFVIEPPLTFQTHFPEKSYIEYSLILIGEVNKSLPFFIFAFDQVGKIGIGKSINGQRGHFILEKVASGQHTAYSNGDQKMNIPRQFENLTVSKATPKSDSTKKIRITIETPLRFKFKNQLKADLPFHVLARAMLRRISSLSHYYGDGEPELDYRGLVARAGEVGIIDNKLKWFDWRRYSLRQDRSMFMGGLVGSVTYEGKIAEYLPFIEFCTRVHVGKQTSFGLGKIAWESIK